MIVIFLFGNDFDNNDNPFECGFEKLVHLNDNVEFIGKDSLKKILKNGLSTTINLSYSTRSPNASELFSDGLHHSLATIELGDLRMKQEKGLKLLLSLEKIYVERTSMQAK